MRTRLLCVALLSVLLGGCVSADCRGGRVRRVRGIGAELSLCPFPCLRIGSFEYGMEGRYNSPCGTMSGGDSAGGGFHGEEKKGE